MKNDTQSILASLVDRLATIKAQQADLAAEEKTIKETLINAGVDRVDGTLHKATIVNVSGRTVTDWQTIAQKFDPSRQLVQAHTTVSAGYVAVKLFSRG